MFDLTKSFNGMFGTVKPGMCRLTMNGNIAIKCSNGYKAYNLKTERLTNVSNFCFDLGGDMFFVIPTFKVTKGDIILVDEKPKCVINVTKTYIECIDYESSEIRKVVPERHVFMGSAYYYGKIVSMFGDNFKNGSGVKNIMKTMLMAKIFSGSGFGNSSTNNTGNPFGNIGQLMAMQMFMGGGNSGFDVFGSMFDGMNFDSDVDEDDNSSETNTKTSKSKTVTEEEEV